MTPTILHVIVFFPLIKVQIFLTRVLSDFQIRLSFRVLYLSRFLLFIYTSAYHSAVCCIAEAGSYSDSRPHEINDELVKSGKSTQYFQIRLCFRVLLFSLRSLFHSSTTDRTNNEATLKKYTHIQTNDNLRKFKII